MFKECSDIDILGILSPWKGLLLYGPPGTGSKLIFQKQLFKNVN